VPQPAWTSRFRWHPTNHSRPEKISPRCCQIDNDSLRSAALRRVDRDQALFTVFARVLPLARKPDPVRLVPRWPKGGRPRASEVSFGVRRCDRCWREFEAVAEHQRFCSRRCRYLGRARDDAKYANPTHRGTRRRLAPVVASGLVRCARGAACRRAELIDGELVGGLILPREPWHLGHPDGESTGGPEHVSCNTGAPSRLRGKMRRRL
jgi:hypothetical protein